jgi:predicted ATPase
MRLKTVFIRFYKSFNYDYLRKFHAKAEGDPWEQFENHWYPYVRIPIDPKVTTVVGANESGKTHLLTSIKAGISGEDIKREDFCRYSQFFTVEAGKLKFPDFGFEWDDLTDTDQRTIRALAKIPETVSFDRFLFFRTNRTEVTTFIPSGADYKKYEISSEHAPNIVQALPTVFEINAKVGLPDSIPIRSLTTLENESGPVEALGRGGRFDLVEALMTFRAQFADAAALASASPQISATVSPFFTNQSTGQSGSKPAEIALAKSLILKIAKVDPEALSDLYKALRDGKEGHSNGLVDQINQRLEASLNFPRWWVQDKEFRLMVSAREFDLVFTIRDKTNTEYSFTERSVGLKYFLSYYIQYLAHEPFNENPEILLMDEPDAFLSSQGQQDLLKIFDAFANPQDARKPVQVIYVTHSPFLIDKNHAERIRVLGKGVDEEGTRVINDASKNHYEPLRSAFGAFVAETTFIGNCNLMVEGTADQVLMAGAATFLRARGILGLETLDLNQITIVPAGSASQVPYMVYLARGRDVEQPAIMVLLDSDQAGNDAKKLLLRGGPQRNQLLRPDFILQIGDLKTEFRVSEEDRIIRETEDLIPLPIAVEAAQRYATEVSGARDVNWLNEARVREKQKSSDLGVFKSIAACFAEAAPESLHIEKLGFSRYVIEVANIFAKSNLSSHQESVVQFEKDFKILFAKLNSMRREAERELSSERVSQRINRAKKSFIRDHTTGAKREEAHVLLEDMEHALDDSLESDYVKLAIQKLRREFQISTEMTEAIDDYGDFIERLNEIEYAGRIATQVETDLTAEPEHASSTGEEKETAVVESNPISEARA